LVCPNGGRLENVLLKRREERRPLFPWLRKGDQEVWWAAALCFFFAQKKGGGCGSFIPKEKKGQWLRKWRVCGQLKREDQLTRGRRKMDQYASRGVAAFCLDQFIYRRSVNRFPNWSLNFSFSLFFFSFFM
jgi:hypothetical protein